MSSRWPNETLFVHFLSVSFMSMDEESFLPPSVHSVKIACFQFSTAVPLKKWNNKKKKLYGVLFVCLNNSAEFSSKIFLLEVLAFAGAQEMLSESHGMPCTSVLQWWPKDRFCSVCREMAVFEWSLPLVPQVGFSTTTIDHSIQRVKYPIIESSHQLGICFLLLFPTVNELR